MTSTASTTAPATGIVSRNETAIFEFRAAVVAATVHGALDKAEMAYHVAAENRDLNKSSTRYTIENAEEHTAETKTWTILFHN